MALLGPKKDGGPNVEFFQSPESMQGFETVRQWLQKNCKKVCVQGGYISRHSSLFYIQALCAHKNNQLTAILKSIYALIKQI